MDKNRNLAEEIVCYTCRHNQNSFNEAAEYCSCDIPYKGIRTQSMWCPDYEKTISPSASDVKSEDPFQELDQYPISREDFDKIFRIPDTYACDGRLPYEGPEFRFWTYDDEVYMLHKPSGTLISYYKLGHTGRANTCNKTLTLEEYRQFSEMLTDELKEYGDKDYKWE